MAKHIARLSTRQKNHSDKLNKHNDMLEEVLELVQPSETVGATKKVRTLTQEQIDKCKAMGIPHTRDEIERFYSDEDYSQYISQKIRKGRVRGPDNTRLALSYLGSARFLHRFSSGPTDDPRDYPDVYNTFLVSEHVHAQSNPKLSLELKEKAARKCIGNTVKNFRNNNRNQWVDSTVVSSKVQYRFYQF